jgi:hypothetical protein
VLSLSPKPIVRLVIAIPIDDAMGSVRAFRRHVRRWRGVHHR